mmetsp:Transcript_34673/g.53121  ORF Transcript_34673/g.53121 Transcript_34673/m.53121 type:complete len:269 (+) Transcript_34673:1223-2029(+)
MAVLRDVEVLQEVVELSIRGEGLAHAQVDQRTILVLVHGTALAQVLDVGGAQGSRREVKVQVLQGLVLAEHNEEVLRQAVADVGATHQQGADRAGDLEELVDGFSSVGGVGLGHVGQVDVLDLGREGHVVDDLIAVDAGVVAQVQDLQLLGSHQTVSDLLGLDVDQLSVRQVQLNDALEVRQNFADALAVLEGQQVVAEIEHADVRHELERLVEVITAVPVHHDVIGVEPLEITAVIVEVLHGLGQELEASVVERVPLTVLEEGEALQ